MNTLTKVIASSVLVFSLPSLASAKDCSESQKLFEQGLEAGKLGLWTKATNTIKQSIDICQKFDNWYLLGQAQYFSQEYPAAESAYIEARKFAKSEDQIALAIARYSEVRNKQGLHSEASNLIHDARGLHSNPPKWMTALALTIDEKLNGQKVSSANLTRALTELPPKSFHKYQPKYSLRLNFKFNSDELVHPEAFDPNVVVQALSSPELEGKTFSLIGHSDVRGGEGYNESLSVKRATAIRTAVSQISPELATRINVEGKGEASPLYKGDSEQEHMLNRRVEIAVIN